MIQTQLYLPSIEFGKERERNINLKKLYIIRASKGSKQIIAKTKFSLLLIESH